MRRSVIISLLAFFALSTAAAQLRSVQFSAAADLVPEKRLGITEASAYGGRLSVSYGVGDAGTVTVDVGYSRYDIEQPDEVVRWGWTIWDRRYRNWVSIYSADTANFTGKVESVQSMESVPVTVKYSHRFPLTEDITVAPLLGAGVEFYTRKLYHNETWTRKYPQDGYQFTYSYHNFAPYKSGNPLFGVAGVNAEARLSRIIVLTAGAELRRYLDTPGSFGYDAYPFSTALSLFAGIGFTY